MNIVKAVFGMLMVSFYMMSYDEIGKRLGVSRQRAEQIFKNALKKLRHPKFLKQNRALLDTMAEIERIKRHKEAISAWDLRA